MTRLPLYYTVFTVSYTDIPCSTCPAVSRPFQVPCTRWPMPMPWLLLQPSVVSVKTCPLSCFARTRRHPDTANLALLNPARPFVTSTHPPRAPQRTESLRRLSGHCGTRSPCVGRVQPLSLAPTWTVRAVLAFFGGPVYRKERFFRADRLVTPFSSCCTCLVPRGYLTTTSHTWPRSSAQPSRGPLSGLERAFDLRP